jgi:hypothetical protein
MTPVVFGPVALLFLSTAGTFALFGHPFVDREAPAT